MTRTARRAQARVTANREAHRTVRPTYRTDPISTGYTPRGRTVRGAWSQGAWSTTSPYYFNQITIDRRWDK